MAGLGLDKERGGQFEGRNGLTQILYKREEHKVKLDDLVGSVRPFMTTFRQDFAEGKVKF